MISLRTKTDLSSEMRLTLQTSMRALKRNRYRSLVFPSLSVTVNHSCLQQTNGVCHPVKISSIQYYTGHAGDICFCNNTNVSKQSAEFVNIPLVSFDITDELVVCRAVWDP